MPDLADKSLRLRLREDTKTAHRALDVRVSGFDLQRPEGLAGFLAMQSGALQYLLTLDPEPDCAAVMQDLLQRADDDLVTLGARRATLPENALTEAHPLAIDYVIGGSRLGTQVLKQRWATSTHPLVQTADAYFGAPTHIAHWKAFCATAEAMPADSAEADLIVIDARRLFVFYEVCAVAARQVMRGFYA
ncbi:MAG: biliverdin-producing heme oxygenase [Pseudomonadota bacterium]